MGKCYPKNTVSWESFRLLYWVSNGLSNIADCNFLASRKVPTMGCLVTVKIFLESKCSRRSSQSFIPAEHFIACNQIQILKRTFCSVDSQILFCLSASGVKNELKISMIHQILMPLLFILVLSEKFGFVIFYLLPIMGMFRASFIGNEANVVQTSFRIGSFSK